MEMYAKRKGWDVGDVEVACDYTPAERGCPTRFDLVMRFPDALSDEQVERLRDDRRQVPGAPHARGRGDVRRAGRARLLRALSRARPARRLRARPARPGRGRRARRPRPHRRGRARPAVPDAGDALHVVLTAAARTCAATPARSRSPAAARTPRTPTCARPRCARPRRRSAWPPDGVELVGALQPTPTIATNYAVYPFVGLIEPGQSWRPPEAEVAEVLELPLPALRDGYGRRRMLRRGVPFRTDTYVVGEHLVWGATARMLADLLDRLDRLG